MSEKKNICICGNEYSHASGLSKHRKVCRDVIIEDFKKKENNKGFESNVMESSNRVEFKATNFFKPGIRGIPIF